MQLYMQVLNLFRGVLREGICKYMLHTNLLHLSVYTHISYQNADCRGWRQLYRARGSKVSGCRPQLCPLPRKFFGLLLIKWCILAHSERLY